MFVHLECTNARVAGFRVIVTILQAHPTPMHASQFVTMHVFHDSEGASLSLISSALWNFKSLEIVIKQIVFTSVGSKSFGKSKRSDLKSVVSYFAKDLPRFSHEALLLQMWNTLKLLRCYSYNMYSVDLVKCHSA